MGITYNKQFTAKDRRIVPSGPRDRQMKQQMMSNPPSGEAALVNELRQQVKDLQKQLSQSSGSGFTVEQVNKEITAAVKEELAIANEKHKQELQSVKSADLESFKKQAIVHEKEIERLKLEHEKEVSSLKEIIKNKEEMIQQLRESGSSSGISEEKMMALLTEATNKMEAMAAQSAGLSESDVDPDRPKMDVQFIDPVEKETNVESYIKTDDFSVEEKEKMASKVNKLKNLMGSLPIKK